MKILIPLLLVACVNGLSPDAARVLNQSSSFNPPDSYRAMWVATEACSKLHGDYYKVSWRKIAVIIDSKDSTYGGVWIPQVNTIILTYPSLSDTRVVTHEEMHALLHGGGDHPPMYFNGLCGPLM